MPRRRASRLLEIYGIFKKYLNFFNEGIEEFELSMTMNITVVDGFGDQVDNVDMYGLFRYF